MILTLVKRREGVTLASLKDALKAVPAPALYVNESERRASFDALLGSDRIADVGELAAVHAYRVTQRHPSSSARASVALVVPVFRNPSMTHEEFDRHWETRHLPLAIRHHVGMCDYWQNTVGEILTPGAPSFDGIAVLGFPTKAAFKDGLVDSPAGGKIIEADSALFVDMTRVESVLMTVYAPG